MTKNLKNGQELTQTRVTNIIILNQLDSSWNHAIAYREQVMNITLADIDYARTTYFRGISMNTIDCFKSLIAYEFLPKGYFYKLVKLARIMLLPHPFYLVPMIPVL